MLSFLFSLGFPFWDSLKLFYAFPQLFQLFLPLPNYFPLHWGNLDSSSKSKLISFKDFWKIVGIYCPIHPHGFGKWSLILILVKMHHHFIYFLKLIIQIHSHHTYPLGSTPLRIKVQMSSFEIQTHKLGVLQQAIGRKSTSIYNISPLLELL